MALTAPVPLNAPAAESIGTQTDRWMLIIAVMAPTVMMMLSSTITNVSVPVMSGELGATNDTISWVLTSYMVAMSIVLPLTGYLNDKLGRRNYLLLSIAGFVLSSALCSMVTSLEQMVFFRILQGISGAAFVPLSRTIVADAYPRHQAAKAMAVWGLGVVGAPIFGPTLGGYLTETFNWRWIFYINIPIGVLGFLLAARFVPETPTKERRMDWLGLVSLALFVGCLQFVLDRGHRDDWFESTSICVGVAISIIAFAVFLHHSLRPNEHPIFDVRVFGDLNFSLGCLVMGATGVAMFGGNFLQPLFMDNLLHYPAMTAGLVLMARGVGSLVSMSISGKIADRMSAKWVALPGVLTGLAGSYMMTRYNAQIDPMDLLLPLFLQGVGIGLIWVPISALAFSTIPQEKSAEASGVYSLVRSITSAMGVSITSTYLAREIESQWSILRGQINPYNPAVQAYLQSIEISSPTQGLSILANTVASQTKLTAFVSGFWFITASFAVMIPLVLLLRSRGGKKRFAGAAASE
ncbi:MAG: DHA2 family efflux MFS transporter permease subunit [Burkholderiales bacterium]